MRARDREIELKREREREREREILPTKPRDRVFLVRSSIPKLRDSIYAFLNDFGAFYVQNEVNRAYLSPSGAGNRPVLAPTGGWRGGLGPQFSKCAYREAPPVETHAAIGSADPDYGGVPPGPGSGRCACFMLWAHSGFRCVYKPGETQRK